MRRANESLQLNDLPNVAGDLFKAPTATDFANAASSTHVPRFLLLTRDVSPFQVGPYSERRESAEELSKRVNIRSI